MNNIDNQNARFFRTSGQLRSHWGAYDQIRTIINRREKSLETLELVNRRIELAKPGVMQPQWHRGLGRDIHVPRRPEEDERREIKGIDLQLKGKEKEARIGGGYFRNFGDEIPPRPQSQDQTDGRNETA